MRALLSYHWSELWTCFIGHADHFDLILCSCPSFTPHWPWCFLSNTGSYYMERQAERSDWYIAVLPPSLLHLYLLLSSKKEKKNYSWPLYSFHHNFLAQWTSIWFPSATIIRIWVCGRIGKYWYISIYQAKDEATYCSQRASSRPML